MYSERFYREAAEGGRFRAFRVAAGESDLWIGWRGGDGAEGDLPEEPLREESARVLDRVRRDIVEWSSVRANFLESLESLDDEDSAPEIVRAMLRAGLSAGVGPMAAVAGAIAESVGSALKGRFGLREIVVENGGDLWIDVAEPLTVAVYAGLSSLSEKVGIIVSPERCPCGLATSSGTVGPSLSYGKADAAIAISSDAAMADAWATAIGNRCRSWRDAEAAVGSLIGPSHPELDGVLVVMADKMAAAGAVRLAPLQKERR